MKLFTLLICTFPLITFSQGLSRQLYQHYFERLFEYEPSVIRESNISTIVKRTTRLIGDSVVYHQIDDSMTFRKDGRPINRIYWYGDYHTSIICNYTYDSLNNLTALREWEPEKDVTPRRERRYILYTYDSTRLKTVFRYSGNDNPDYLMMESCDSLHYVKNKSHVEIFTGCTPPNILFSADTQPVFVSSGNSKRTMDYTMTGNSEKPIDKKAIWEDEKRCNYDHIPPLLELQKTTGIRCFPSALSNAMNVPMIKTIENDSIIEFEFLTLDNILNEPGTILHIDKKSQTIKIQLVEIHHIPTSMEDYITQHRTIFHYDFSLKLIYKEGFLKNMGRNDVERSIRTSITNDNERGEYEQLLKELKKEYLNYVTTYDYYENGLLQQEITRYAPPGWRTNDGSKSSQVRYEITYGE